jgi:hypothetical protein
MASQKPKKSAKKYPVPAEADDKNHLDQVNPWANASPDCLTQSGSDWYRIALSASLGGRVLHGVNTAPSMEVLGKSPYTPDETTSAGFIRWDPRTFNETSLGNRVSDQFYIHHKYRGGQTKSGALLAFDEGAWEPSLRGRARSSSLLAAGLIAHGISKTDALETVSRITSDEVDPEAVESTLLPSSHLKREMVTVSKASHRVFSQGTLQQGIIWDDSRVNLSKKVPHIAYDWGRITAVARYIAEANVQVCPVFREKAIKMDMAYHVVRGAWATVSPEDYKLYPSLFANVRKLDLAKLNVPSIKGAYKDHEKEVFVSLTRFLSNEPDHPVSDIYRGYVHLKRSAQDRVHKKQKVKIASAVNIIDNVETTHTMDDETLSRQLKLLCSSQTLLAMAVKTRSQNDRTFKRAVDNFMTTAVESNMEDKVTISRLVFDQATWVYANAAAKEMAKKLDDSEIYNRAHDLLVIQLSQLKSKLFGLKTHLDAPVVFSEEALSKLSENVRDVLSRANKAPALEIVYKKDLMTPDMMQIENTFTYDNEKTRSILEAIHSESSKVYKKVALVLLASNKQSAINAGAANYFTYIALKTLGMRLCVARSSGYIDGSVPKETYIYKAAKKLSDKFQLGKPKLRFPNYATALTLADDIESSSVLKYNIKEAVASTTVTLDLVVGDVLSGNKFVPPDDLLPEAVEELSDVDSHEYDTKELDEETNLAILERLMAEVNEEFLQDDEDLYAKGLKTYKDKAEAEKYARLNGYQTFKEAIDLIGVQAFKDDENNFTMIGRVMGAGGSKAVTKKVIKKKYQPLR